MVEPEERLRRIREAAEEMFELLASEDGPSWSGDGLTWKWLERRDELVKRINTDST